MREVAGMPHTVTGAPQVAYFEARSPSAAMIDVQVFATAAQAGAEEAAAERKLPGFHATTITNAIAFSHGTGRSTVPAAALRELRAARP